MIRSASTFNIRRLGRSARSGISLAEVLVIVAIVVILFSIFVPYVGKIRELDRRSRCANNLRAIHAALASYAGANKDYPRTEVDPSAGPHYVAYTGADIDPTLPAPRAASSPATNLSATLPTTGPVAPIGPSLPLAAVTPSSQPAIAAVAASQPTRPAPIVAKPGAVQPNDVTASLWLLVRLGYADPSLFICPSGDESVDPVKTAGRAVRADQRSNFTSGQSLSYSYAYPFLDIGGKPQINSDRLPPDFPILADKNPGPPAAGESAFPAFDAPLLSMAAVNSHNHGGAGQNVLYVIGNVQFQTTPYCGYGVPPDLAKTIYRDNLFTAYAASSLPPGVTPKDPQATGVCRPNVGPAWAYDSYLVPTAKD